ncbi:hypothetical protein [Streptomyces sp. NPDC052015]|uniref:hypothetical protein n=1 Tax=Streptomyces sp. NPDC052015 TaxID=3154755 RepID=UPI00343E58C2
MPYAPEPYVSAHDPAVPAPTPRGRRRIPRPFLLLAALASAAALTTTACSGPGGVELGTDWEGSSTFALAEVDGLVTVVGIDPAEPGAQSLAVVPQQADDDDSVSPHIVRLADGRWMLSVPRTNGKPDRRYLVNREDHTLDGMTGDERLRRTLPGRTLVAEVAGLPGADGKSSVLVKNPADWTTERELEVPGTIGLAASDPASDVVCVAAGNTVSTADLTTGKVTPVPVPKGLTVDQLACPAGHPVVVGAPASAASGRVAVSLTRQAAVTTVSVTGARADAVAARGSSIVVAAAKGDDTELIEVDAHSGKELRRATVRGMAASLALTPTSAGWLLYAEDSVTRVDLATGKTKRFDLPGTLLDS